MSEREVLDPCMECGRLCDWAAGPTWGVCNHCWRELTEEVAPRKVEEPDPELLDLLKEPKCL